MRTLLDILRRRRDGEEELVNIDHVLGPANMSEAMHYGTIQGLNYAMDVVRDLSPLVPCHPLEDLSGQMLSRARAALADSRCTAYPGTASELEGYARGLQQAGEDLQKLLTELRGGQ